MLNIEGKMRRIKHLHFVGIGGSGMCGIAEVLLKQGYKISGSDLNPSQVTTRLIDLGACINFEHKQQNIQGADAIVVSTAIDANNPEIIEAQKNLIPIVRRAEMLAELMRFKYGIAVAGTHGKTTTTSMLVSIFEKSGKSPTFVIGGKLNSAGTNAGIGESKYLIAEADESDASFLHLQPMVSVITNIDEDHMSTYGGDFSVLENTFLDFIKNLPFYGLCVLCTDDANVKNILPKVSRPFVTYGFNEDAQFKGSDFVQTGRNIAFKATKPDGKVLDIKMQIPGKHNALNALATIAIASDEGINDEAIIAGLADFSGVGRRFNIYEDLPLGDANFTLIDDYGHHPQELRAVIEAYRKGWKNRLVMLFQPHRYSRTHDLYQDFIQVLSEVDLLLLLDVYSAGEKEIPGADSKSLANSIRQRGKTDPIYISSKAELLPLLKDLLKEGDTLLTQGAGNVGTLAQDILKASASGYFLNKK